MNFIIPVVFLLLAIITAYLIQLIFRKLLDIFGYVIRGIPETNETNNSQVLSSSDKVNETSSDKIVETLSHLRGGTAEQISNGSLKEPLLEEFGLTREDYNKHISIKNQTDTESTIGFKITGFFVVTVWLILTVKTIIESNKPIIDIIGTLFLYVIALLVIGVVTTMYLGAFVQLFIELILYILRKLRLLKSREELLEEDDTHKKIQAYEKQVKAYKVYLDEELRKKKDFWYKLSGNEFEKELAKIYEKLGYKVSFTPVSNDGGVDLILKKSSENIIVQCKAHKKKLGPSTVRELYGALQSSKADSAILATLEGVSSNANNFVSDKPINIITVKDILKMQEQLDKNKL